MRREGGRQRLGEGGKVFRAATADADAAVMRCDERHAHEDITRDQFGNKAAGERTVFPGVDGDEIGGRGQRERPFSRAMSEISVRAAATIAQTRGR